MNDSATYAGGPFPRPLTEDDLADPEVWPNRHDMAADLFDGFLQLAEVGTWKGMFAEHLLEACDPDELHLFDRNMRHVPQHLRRDARVHLHPGDSSTRLGDVPDGYFGGVYIDGDHSREGVSRDAEVVKLKVRSGGVVIFNDYTLWSVIEEVPYGIPHAVADLCDDGFRIVGFAFQFQGYHDVALKAP